MSTRSVVHKIYLERLKLNAEDYNLISKEKGKSVLCYIYRIPKSFVNQVLHEMYEDGLIDIRKNKWIYLKNW